MIVTIAPHFAQVAAACFPVARCTVRGYSKPAGYTLTLFPPQPFAGPAAYTGNGRTCYDALAAAISLFHASAHAYPAARPLAAAGSYSPPQQPQLFPSDDEEQDFARERYDEDQEEEDQDEEDQEEENQDEEELTNYEPGGWEPAGEEHDGSNYPGKYGH